MSGLTQAQIKAIASRAQDRVNTVWKAQGLSGEPIELPLGWVEICAESTIEMLPLLLLQPEQFVEQRIARIE